MEISFQSGFYTSAGGKMFVYWPLFDRLVRIKRGRHACILIYLIFIHTLTRLPDSGVHVWVGATCGINTRKIAISSTLPSTSKWKPELKMLKTLLSLFACLALVAATPFRDCGKCSFYSSYSKLKLIRFVELCRIVIHCHRVPCS